MILETLLPEHAGQLRIAFTFLSQLTPDQLNAAARAIEHETTLGPLLDPSAYTDGKRFENAAIYIDLFRSLCPVVELLQAVRVSGRHDAGVLL